MTAILSPKQIKDYIRNSITEPINNIAELNVTVLYDYFSDLCRNAQFLFTIKKIINSGYKPTVEQIKSLIDRGFGGLSFYGEIINCIMDNDITLLYNHMTALCDTNDFPAIISKIIDSGYKLNETQVHKLIYRHHFYAIKGIEQYGLNEKMIEWACKCANIEVLVYGLDNKIIPNDKMFNNIFESSDKNIYYNMINILVKYGYNITYQNFVDITKNGVEWNDVPDEYFTEEINDICDELHFYPKYYKTSVKKLAYACTMNDLKAIKEIIKGGIELNMNCLEQACKSSKVPTLRLLIEDKKMILNNNCLRNSLENTKLSRKYIVEKYIQQHP